MEGAALDAERAHVSRLASASSDDFFLERSDFYDDAVGAMPHLSYFSSLDSLGDAIDAVARESARLTSVVPAQVTSEAPRARP